MKILIYIINRILISIQLTNILLLHKSNDKKFFLNLETIAVLWKSRGILANIGRKKVC